MKMHPFFASHAVIAVVSLSCLGRVNINPVVVIFVVIATTIITFKQLPPTGNGKVSQENVESFETTGILMELDEKVFATPKKCWANGYARFKYFGLRHCWEPEDLPYEPLTLEQAFALSLPQQTSDEAAKLHILAGKLADERAKGQRVDPTNLLRYLRAEKGDVIKAEQYFRKAMKFRRDYDVDNMFTHWNLDKYEKCLAPWYVCGGYVGWSRSGNPVCYWPIGVTRWMDVVAKIPWEDIVKLDLVFQQRGLAAIEHAALQRNEPAKRLLAIVDMSGFGWDQCQLHASRLLAKLTAIRDLMMPSSMELLLVINAPPAFTSAWRMFKHILAQDTRDKFRFATPAQSIALMQQYVDLESLPRFLGGSIISNGDPYCRDRYGLGGPMPQEAIDRFLRMGEASNGSSSTLSTTASENPACRGGFSCALNSSDGKNQGRFDPFCCGRRLT